MSEKLKAFDVKTGRRKKEYREYEEIERHHPCSSLFADYGTPPTFYQVHRFWKPVLISSEIKEAKKK